jgi:hypothetical protein
VAQVKQVASSNIRSMSLQDDVNDDISGVHDLDIDNINTAGMTVHGGVHDLDQDMESQNPADQNESQEYFEFIDASNKTVWDIQVIVASWVMNIEQNEYTNGIRQDIDKLLMDITMAGSTLEMMSQSQSFKPLRDYKNMMSAMQQTIDGICNDYSELKPIANRMLLT